MALNAGLFDSLELDKVREAEVQVRKAVLDKLPESCQKIDCGESVEDEDWIKLIEVARKSIDQNESDTYANH